MTDTDMDKLEIAVHKMIAENNRLKAVNAELLEALQQAQILAEDTCRGQHSKNECWNILAQISDAITKAKE